MGKKGNLLTEAQVRQFMKLANLKPLTPGFVDGLDESAPVDESHGRGRGEGAAGYGHPDDDRAGARLREAEDEFPEDELGPDEPAGEELEPEELEPLPPEEDLGEVGDREVNVDDFLAALEVALEDVLGDEVEVDQEEEVEEVEPEAEVEEVEPMEEPLPGEEVPELQEMINKITKRVAKRIVKEALQNKK